MAKILLFSDIHSHPFKAYATINAEGMNSRLADAISCINQIYEYAVANDADVVLFGGDMFHVRKHINVTAFNAVYVGMSQFSVSKIPVLLIPGNHDQCDKEGHDHSIYAFRTFLEVADKPGWYELRGKSGKLYDICAIPYCDDVEMIHGLVNGRPRTLHTTLLLGHLGVQGAKVGADFVYTNPRDPTVVDLNCSYFDACFLGHYHEHQQLAPNCWYIGAPLQHTWGDTGQQRGFLEYDTDTGAIQKILLQSPKFVLLSDHDAQLALAGHHTFPDGRDGFVRVVSDRSWLDADLEKLQECLGSRTIEVIPPKLYSLETQPARMNIDISMSLTEMLDSFVKSGLAEMEGLDEDYLLDLGRSIIREIESG
jgi:DNA repair exonuclease SbcCD nuclease subunit